MNTISSIVTFLMVFLLQRSQNKDSLVIQVKLNEIVAALKGASNRLVNVEDWSEDEIRDLHKHDEEIAARARSGSPGEPTSIDKITSNEPNKKSDGAAA